MATPRKWAYPLTALVLGLQAVQATPAVAQNQTQDKSQTQALSQVVADQRPLELDLSVGEKFPNLLALDPASPGPAVAADFTLNVVPAPTGETMAVSGAGVPVLVPEVDLPTVSLAPVTLAQADMPRGEGAQPVALDLAPVAGDAAVAPGMPLEGRVTDAQVTDSLETSIDRSAAALDQLEESQPYRGLILPTFDLGEVLAVDPNAPVVPVEQLRNIEADHWAAQAVKQLGDRYECFDTSDPFASKAALTRYEFAAYVEPCLAQLNDMIEAETANLPNRDDLAAIQRLQEEFAAELATLTGRIDAVEERIVTLEENRFSEKTKLFGIGSFLLSAAYGNNGNEANPVYNATAILDFDTRFTGSDLLRAEMRASNMSFIRSSEVTGTGMSLLNVVPESDAAYRHITGGGAPPSGVADFELSSLFYQMRFAQKGLLRVGTHGITSNSLIPDLSIIPSASLYGVRSPIYRNSVGGGAVVFYQFNDLVSWGASYLSKNPDLDRPNGLFDGRFGALTQVTLTPTPKLGIGLTYGRHNSDGRPIWAGTGSTNASFPFGFLFPEGSRNFEDGTGVNRVGANVNDFGLTVRYQAAKKVTVGGWFGYSLANAVDSAEFAGGASTGDDAQIMYWAAGMKVQDLGRRGNQLGLLIGMPPKVINNDYAAGEDTGTSLHFEMTYRHRINNRVYLQPGLYFVTNPGHNDNNDTLWIPTLNTLFVF
ncbi:MAG: iron uptake porin [Prochlorothrix sp.]